MTVLIPGNFYKKFKTQVFEFDWSLEMVFDFEYCLQGWKDYLGDFFEWFGGQNNGDSMLNVDRES